MNQQMNIAIFPDEKEQLIEAIESQNKSATGRKMQITKENQTEEFVHLTIEAENNADFFYLGIDLQRISKKHG